jgi:hypothetical protein
LLDVSFGVLPDELAEMLPEPGAGAFVAALGRGLHCLFLATPWLPAVSTMS